MIINSLKGIHWPYGGICAKTFNCCITSWNVKWLFQGSKWWNKFWILCMLSWRCCVWRCYHKLISFQFPFFYTCSSWYFDGIEQVEQNVLIWSHWYCINLRMKLNICTHNFDMLIYSWKISNTLKFNFKIFSSLQEAFGVSKSSAHLLQMGNTKFIFFIIGTFVIDLAILKSVRQLESGICSKNGWLLWP